MEEVNTSGAPAGLDMLNARDLSQTSTEYPLLAATVARITLHKMEVAPNKAGNGQNLKIQLKTNSPLKLHGKEGEANAGHVVHEMVSLTKTDKYDPDVNLARILLCFTGSKATPAGGWASLIGQQGDVRFKVDENPEFGDRNRVASWIEKTEDSVAATM